MPVALRSILLPATPEFFAGKLGLDAGCGFGRHLYYAREFGARMVGVDFSVAIQAARAILGGRDGTSLVQADLYHLPFKPEAFDFIYSLGALHHLPDPEERFRRLRPCLKQLDNFRCPDGFLRLQDRRENGRRSRTCDFGSGTRGFLAPGEILTAGSKEQSWIPYDFGHRSFRLEGVRRASMARFL